LPLSKPGLASTFILVLIMAWNEYLFALFLSSANAQTLPLTVAAQNATRGPQWWYMSVLIIIMIVPVSALALLLARYITRGLLIGAVKGGARPRRKWVHRAHSGHVRDRRRGLFELQRRRLCGENQNCREVPGWVKWATRGEAGEGSMPKKRKAETRKVKIGRHKVVSYSYGESD